MHHPLELLEDGGEQGRALVRVEAGVHPEGAAVGVRRTEGRDVIRERASLPQLDEEAAAHPVPQDGAEQVERPPVGMVSRHPSHADAQVPLGEAAESEAHRSRGRQSGRLERSWQLGGALDRRSLEP